MVFNIFFLIDGNILKETQASISNAINAREANEIKDKEANEVNGFFSRGFFIQIIENKPKKFSSFYELCSTFMKLDWFI